MKQNKGLKNFLSTLPLIAVIISSLLLGAIAGNFISSKAFSNTILTSSDIESLRDNISSAELSKSPIAVSGATAFQLAEKVQRESTNYEIIGDGTIDTSLGVSQSSRTIDRRNGNELYIAFTTFSTFVKESRQSSFVIGGDINLQHGTPTDASTTNVNWSNTSDHYTWQSYYDTFGKYANINCSYIVSSKTVISDSGMIKDGNLYRCTLELNPILGSSAYIKQIGANMGVDPATIKFHKILFTFWIDENYKFVKQEKFESYTVPYLGINLTLNATVNVSYSIH